MKKVVLFFAAALVAVSFAACGQKAAQNNEEANDTTPKQEVVDNQAPNADEVPVETPAPEVAE